MTRDLFFVVQTEANVVSVSLLQERPSAKPGACAVCAAARAGGRTGVTNVACLRCCQRLLATAPHAAAEGAMAWALMRQPACNAKVRARSRDVVAQAVLP